MSTVSTPVVSTPVVAAPVAAPVEVIAAPVAAVPVVATPVVTTVAPETPVATTQVVAPVVATTPTVTAAAPAVAAAVVTATPETTVATNPVVAPVAAAPTVTAATPVAAPAVAAATAPAAPVAAHAAPVAAPVAPVAPTAAQPGSVATTTLVVDHPMSNITASAGQTLVFSIPKGTFADSAPNAQVTFKATLADGSPLPNWLHFNSSTGTFSGTPPAGEGDLHIKVNAVDNKGNEAATTFTVKSGKTSGDDSNAPPQKHSAMTGKGLLAALGFKGFGWVSDEDDADQDADQNTDPNAPHQASTDSANATDGHSAVKTVTNIKNAPAPHLSAQLQKEAQRFSQARTATLQHLAAIEQMRRMG